MTRNRDQLFPQEASRLDGAACRRVDVVETRGQGDPGGPRHPEPRPQLYDRFGQPVGRFWWVAPSLAIFVVAGLLVLVILAEATL